METCSDGEGRQQTVRLNRFWVSEIHYKLQKKFILAHLKTFQGGQEIMEGTKSTYLHFCRSQEVGRTLEVETTKPSLNVEAVLYDRTGVSSCSAFINV